MYWSVAAAAVVAALAVTACATPIGGFGRYDIPSAPKGVHEALKSGYEHRMSREAPEGRPLADLAGEQV